MSAPNTGATNNVANIPPGGVGQNDIQKSYQRFNAYVQKGRPERIREKTNHDLNDGTNFRHWAGLTASDLQSMAAEGRHPTTINFTKQAIYTIAGSIVADQMQGQYMSGWQIPTAYGDGILELFNRDSNIGKWDGKITQWIREAFIYRGTMAWEISTDVDPRGILTLVKKPPDRVIYDPNWMTTDVNDNNRIFEFTYKSLRELIGEFGAVAPWLRSKAAGGEYTEDNSQSSGIQVRAFDLNPDLKIDLDGELLVVNEFWLETQRVERIFNSYTGLYHDEIPVDQRREWVENERALGGRVAIVPDTIKVEKFITYCPTLSTFRKINGGDYPVQVGGYHFLPLTCDILNGKPNTPTDQLKDPQVMVDKRMSTETFILATQGTNGLAAHRKMFASDAEFDRWKDEGHKPGYKGELSDEAAAGQYKFVEIPRTTAANDFLNSTKNILAMKDQVVPSVPAVQGLSEANESGVLFQSKVQQANITMIVPKSFIREGYEKLYDSYFRAVKHVYIYPITLHGQQPNAIYSFNYGTPDSIEIQDISRLGVMVYESPTSASKRSTMVQEASMAMQYMDPNSLRARTLSGIVGSSLPNLSDAQRKAMEEAGAVDDELYMLRAKAEAAQLQQQLQPPAAPVPGAAPQMQPA